MNFKLGVTYRPIENLRIGAAFHTPTYYSFDRKYQGAMASLSYANRHTDPDVTPDKDGYIPLEMQTPLLQDDGPNSWSFISPSRLLLGVSYAFGSRGVIAVDYERAWYNGIRVKDTPSGVPSGSYDDTFRSVFKGANTLRVGAEFKPVPVVSLRAGFGVTGSCCRTGIRSFRRRSPSGSPITAPAWGSSSRGASCSTSPTATRRPR